MTTHSRRLARLPVLAGSRNVEHPAHAVSTVPEVPEEAHVAHTIVTRSTRTEIRLLEMVHVHNYKKRAYVKPVRYMVSKYSV